MLLSGKYNQSAGAPSFALLAKGGIPQLLTHTVVYPILRKNREGWGTRSSRRYRPAHPRPCHSASTLVRNPG
jgi:hypothetical protein